MKTLLYHERDETGGYSALLVLTALLCLAAPAARAAEVNDNIYNYLQLLRSDINSPKSRWSTRS